MLKLINIKKEQFDEFVIKQDKISHFMQSVAWGDFSKVNYNLTPYYLGLINENNEVIAATLILEKQLKMNYTGYYIPFGYVIDFNKKELVKEMTNKLTELLKSKKALYINMNPNVIKKTINYLDEEEVNDKYIEVLNTLRINRFKHNKSDKTNTFIIDLENDITSSISKETKDIINDNKKIVVETTMGSKKDIKYLYNEKHNNKYYDTIFEIFNGNKHTTANIVLQKLNTIKTINEYEKELKKINNQISIVPIDHLTKSSKDKLNTLTAIKKELLDKITYYKNLRKQYGYEIVITTFLVIEYGNKAYILDVNNNDKINDNNIYYLSYYETINYYQSNNFKKLIQCEEPSIIKKSFGGKYIEHIGEVQYITKPILYFILKRIMKII